MSRMLEENHEESCEKDEGDHGGVEIAEGDSVEEKMYGIHSDELVLDAFEKVISGSNRKLSIGF